MPRGNVTLGEVSERLVELDHDEAMVYFEDVFIGEWHELLSQVLRKGEYQKLVADLKGLIGETLKLRESDHG